MKSRVTIGIGDMLGCGYYRCILPYRALANHGADVLVTNILSEELLAQTDFLVLQRQHSDDVLRLATWFKANVPNGKLVFEFDDNLHALPKSNPSSRVYFNGSPASKNMETMVRLADLVTVSTDSLVRDYSRFNKNIHVCHNAVDPEIVSQISADIFEQRPKGEHFRLGWAGSGTHHDDFMTAIKPLMEVMQERLNVKFVFIGSDMRSFFPMAMRSRNEYFGNTFPHDHRGNATNYDSRSDISPTIQYYQMLKAANLDAAIAPLERYSFNSCKSAIKLIEYGITGIPYIATRFGPYQLYTGPYSFQNREAAFGLNAETAKDWKRCLFEMIDNAPLREKLKRNNYENILANHTVPSMTAEWISAYASIGHTFSGPGRYVEKIDKNQMVA